MCRKLIKKFCEKYHHEESEFQRAPMSEKERLDEQESVLLEILEIIGGAEE